MEGVINAPKIFKMRLMGNARRVLVTDRTRILG
jgi:hypothetical protein